MGRLIGEVRYADGQIAKVGDKVRYFSDSVGELYSVIDVFKNYQSPNNFIRHKNVVRIVSQVPGTWPVTMYSEFLVKAEPQNNG